MKKLITLLAATFVLATAYAGEFADISLTDVQALTASKTAVIIDVNGNDS